METIFILIIVIVGIIIFLMISGSSLYEFYVNLKVLKSNKEKDENKLKKRITRKIDELKETNECVDYFEYDVPTIDNFDHLYSIVLGNNDTPTTILYLHDGIGDALEHSDKLLNLNKYANVIAYDYRGYGLSDGHPSETKIHKDIILLWEHLTKHMELNNENIILYGEGVGAVFVTYLCRQLITEKKNLPKLIILDNPLWYYQKMFGGKLFDAEKHFCFIHSYLPIYILINDNDISLRKQTNKIIKYKKTSVFLYNNQIKLDDVIS